MVEQSGSHEVEELRESRLREEKRKEEEEKVEALEGLRRNNRGLFFWIFFFYNIPSCSV